jgi:hypothetical protein
MKNWKTYTAAAGLALAAVARLLSEQTTWPEFITEISAALAVVGFRHAMAKNGGGS